jgi:hypothetical protein
VFFGQGRPVQRLRADTRIWEMSLVAAALGVRSSGIRVPRRRRADLADAWLALIAPFVQRGAVHDARAAVARPRTRIRDRS